MSAKKSIKGLLQTIKSASQGGPGRPALPKRSPAEFRQALNSPEFSGAAYLSSTERLWSRMLATLPLDVLAAIFLPGLIVGTFHTQVLDFLMGFLCIICLLALQADKLLDALLATQRLLVKVLSSQPGSLIASALAVIAIAAEVFVRIGSTSLLALIVIGLVVLSAVPSVLKALAERRAQNLNLLDDPLEMVLTTNRLIFALRAIPILAARLISLVSTLKLCLGGGTLIQGLGFTVASFVLLLIYRPERSSFACLCRGCSMPAPLALRNCGYCPRCSPGEFTPR